jgi:hypothetical protein
MFNFTEELYGVWCDGEALNMKWPSFTVWCSDMENKFKNTFHYLDRVQISEQFTYILTSGKAVLPSYMRQGGANFEL